MVVSRKLSFGIRMSVPHDFRAARTLEGLGAEELLPLATVGDEPLRVILHNPQQHRDRIPCVQSMALLQSCCCWQSVRKGSYACAVYTGIYFTLLTITTATLLHAENQYLTGKRSSPESSSLLEPETISPTTVTFNVLLLICSSCGVVCSFLLVYGLFKNKKSFLLPWIITVVACSTIDVAHSLYLLIVTSNFNPITAMLYTLNFFLLCLNIYSLLCVISQYQEYMAGRGTAADNNEYMGSTVKYTVQTTTTTTSYLNSRKATNNETKATSTSTPTPTPTPTQTPMHSPTLIQNLSSMDKRLTVPRASKKHVQFPDAPTSIETRKLESLTTSSTLKWLSEMEIVKMTASSSEEATL